MYFKIFIIVFFTHWFALILLYIKIRLRLKKEYSDIYNHLFTKDIFDQSINNSLLFIRFALQRKQWSEITDKKTIKLLSINRAITISIYAIGALVFSVITGAVIYDIFTGGLR